MKQRLGYVLLLGLATGALAVSACGDDNSSSANDSGGAAGESGSSAGTKTGGSTAGGSSNKAGTDSGGEAGNGTAGVSPEGGTGGGTDGGTGGVNDGGSGGNSAGAAGSDAGAAGTAGAGGAGLVYACGSDDKFQKLCSAKVAADCPDPTDCSDCVTQVTSDYEGSLVGCAACDAKVDAYYQCGIDAFESGNLAAGIQCIDQVGADLSDDCSALFDEYFDCSNDIAAHGCPATWPPQ